MLRYLFLLFTSLCFSQTTIKGIVTDTLNIPLDNANIIAKPFEDKAEIKFAIADDKGRYRIELNNTIQYEITVSYIGFFDETFIVDANSTIDNHHFSLKPSNEKLKEIAIKNSYKPIVVKEDTISFDIKSFANGNENKMKEVLQKLPGIEVDKNGNVEYQGKKITKMLVEGKSFFGGGTKLAVENIPANALDKIEIIDHFNEVDFMKKVSNSNDIALNVRLKEDKKKFVFGEVQAGLEVGNGDNNFHLLHSSLFYYSPKKDISLISDINTISKSTFTTEDLMRYDNTISNYLSDRKSLTNLSSFSQENKDLSASRSQFAAVNFSTEVSKKTTISGFGIFSKTITDSQKANKNTYLQNSVLSFENAFENNHNKTTLLLVNLKLDYSPSNTQKIYYNTQYQSSNNANNTSLNSITNLNTNVFETLNNADNNSIKQYLEWHKSYNKHQSTTLIINQVFEKSTPTNNWRGNQHFLKSLIPLQTDSLYITNQTKTIRNNSVDAVFKHYWIINNNHHFYTSIGDNYGTSNLVISEKQLLTNGETNNFDKAGFGNAIIYKLNDMYVGFEFKLKIGKWTNRPGIYFHWYDLTTTQFDINTALCKKYIQPQWNSSYEFSKSESLNFNYKLTNNFPSANNLINRQTIATYNSVYKGNALLENEQYHSINLYYSKTNRYHGIEIFGDINFNKKTKTIRNDIILSGIEQYYTPEITDNPETNLGLDCSITKKIYLFNLKLDTSLKWYNYTQSINNLVSINNINAQNIGISLRTANAKWGDIGIGYRKGFNQLIASNTTKFQNDSFTSDFEIRLFKSFLLKIDFENHENRNNSNQSNYYQIANSSLSYQQKNSSFVFEFTANNLLDTKVKSSYTFSDYLIHQQVISVLPRVLLLSISYKL